MTIFKTLNKDKRGMALIIVLTASFLALVMIGVGATLLSNNIDKLTSVVNRNKTNENIKSGFERVRALGKVSPAYLASCNTGDCINTTDASCVTCANGVIDLGNGNRQKVEITNITQPVATEEGYAAGSVNVLVTGYYKNLASQRSFTSCLSYCNVAGYNCGDNGCGGSCGTCSLPDTCGGGGSPGVCGSPALVCPNDVAVECNAACVEGDSCGGGRLISVNDHIVAIGGGCSNTSGTDCGGGDDRLNRIWFNSFAEPSDTGAVDQDDGRNNAETLRALGGGADIPAEYEAVKFCDDLSYSGFTNWYLPAQNELTALYNAYQNTWVSNFRSDCYWSSTETDATSAYYYDFSGAVSFCNGGKSSSNYIRCLRRW